MLQRAKSERKTIVTGRFNLLRRLLSEHRVQLTFLSRWDVARSRPREKHPQTFVEIFVCVLFGVFMCLPARAHVCVQSLSLKSCREQIRRKSQVLSYFHASKFCESTLRRTTTSSLDSHQSKFTEADLKDESSVNALRSAIGDSA